MLKRMRLSKKQKPEINEWLFPKTTVILISGKAGVGKTTTANYIKDYLDKNITPYSHVVAFALGVKKVAKMIGWDGEKDERGRKLLQDIGNFGRDYSQEAWVKFLLDSISESIPNEYIDVLLIDDWRFPNEAKFFLEQPNLYKPFTIKIESPKREILKGTSAYKDVSETSLDGYHKFNYIIENDGTLEGLETKSVSVLYDIIEESKKGGKS